MCHAISCSLCLCSLLFYRGYPLLCSFPQVHEKLITGMTEFRSRCSNIRHTSLLTCTFPLCELTLHHRSREHCVQNYLIKKKDTQYSSWWDRTQWITTVFDFLTRYTWLHLVTSVLIRNSPSETKMRHADTLHRSFEAPSPSHFSSTAELRNDMAMLCGAASLLKTWNILLVWLCLHPCHWQSWTWTRKCCGMNWQLQ